MPENARLASFAKASVCDSLGSQNREVVKNDPVEGISMAATTEITSIASRSLLKGTICSSRLKRRQKTVVSGRFCWWLELVAGHATSRGKIENEERSPRN